MELESPIYPGWAAPLLGAGGCAVGALFIIAPQEVTLKSVGFIAGAGCLGALGGTFVWMRDPFHEATPVQHGIEELDAIDQARGDVPPTPPRPTVVARPDPIPQRTPKWWDSFAALGMGVFMLALHHALAVSMERKYFMLVAGGSLLLAVGISGILLLPFSKRIHAQDKVATMLRNAVLFVATCGGFAFTYWLWAFVYA